MSARRKCAVSIVGQSDTRAGVMLHHRLIFVEGENRQQVEEKARLNFVTDHRGADVLSILIEPVQREVNDAS